MLLVQIFNFTLNLFQVNSIKVSYIACSILTNFVSKAVSGLSLPAPFENGKLSESVAQMLLQIIDERVPLSMTLNLERIGYKTHQQEEED